MEHDVAEWTVAVGKVARPHGIRGALNVIPMTSHVERFGALEWVCVCLASGKRRVHRVTGWRRAGRRVLLTLEGIEDRTAAEKLRGAVLRIKPEMRYPLDEDEYYVDDLIGLAVVTTDGRDLGRVRDVLSLPGNDVYVAEHALIPAVKQFVRRVDLEKREIVVEPVEGLAPELGI